MVISVKPSPVVLRFRPGRYPTIPKQYPFAVPGPVFQTTQLAKQETLGKSGGC